MKTFISIILVISTLSLSSCARRTVVRSNQGVTIVQTLPKQHKIVRVKGKRYYFWNGNHYRKTRKGFVLVRL